MRVVKSRAPIRICDMGGWTDTWFCKRGAVLSFAADLYTHVRIESTGEKTVRIVSEDLGQEKTFEEADKIEYGGDLDLIRAAIRRTGANGGFNLYIRADAPPSCGVGTSASVAVAAIGALTRYCGKHMTPHQTAEMAHALETDELGLESGVQDQYAATFGGVCFMEIDYPRVRISQLKLEERALLEFEERILVAYFGPRNSSQMHLRVVEKYRRSDPQTIAAFDRLTETPYQMVDALSAGDLDLVGELMNRNQEAQCKLHPEMTTPAIEAARKTAFKNGAAGFKINGAGGGGSATVLARSGREQELKAALLKSGVSLLPCKLNFEGLQTWE